MSDTTSKPVALVTGAAQGIGEAIARMLGTAGHIVVLGDVDDGLVRQTALGLQNRGIEAAGIRLDVTRAADWAEACAAFLRGGVSCPCHSSRAFASSTIRLIPREAGTGRIAAMEIMLNSPLVQDLIFRGEVAKIKEVMSRSTRIGMKTFDQSLFDLYEQGIISYEDALRNSDSKNELRLRVKLESKRETKPLDAESELTIVEDMQGKNF